MPSFFLHKKKMPVDNIPRNKEGDYIGVYISGIF